MFAMIMMMWVTNDTKQSYSDDDDQKFINFLKNTILILNKTCPFYNHNYTFLNSFIVHIIAYNFTVFEFFSSHNDDTMTEANHFCYTFAILLLISFQWHWQRQKYYCW